MESLAETIGAAFMICGGFCIAALAVGVLCGFLADVWRSASYKWRGILQGESLIWEYRKNREQYMKWRAEVVADESRK